MRHTHRTTIAVPPDADRQAVYEAVERIREVAYPREVTGAHVVVDFDEDDEYDLAIRVSDLERELQAAQAFTWEVPRPARIPPPNPEGTLAHHRVEIMVYFFTRPGARAKRNYSVPTRTGSRAGKAAAEAAAQAIRDSGCAVARTSHGTTRLHDVTVEAEA